MIIDANHFPIQTQAKIRIRRLFLAGGASQGSQWPALRGGAVQFDPQRTARLVLNGKLLLVPAGCLLVDRDYFAQVRHVVNQGRYVPHRLLTGLSRSEDFYLVHASYCYPKRLFLPPGTFTSAVYAEQTEPLRHLNWTGSVLHLKESELDKRADRPFNILAEIKELNRLPARIIVELKEGGAVTLTNEEPKLVYLARWLSRTFSREKLVILSSSFIPS